MSVLFRFCHGGCFLKGSFVHACISARLATQFKTSSSLFRIQGKFQNGMVDPLSNFYFIPTIGPVHSWHLIKNLINFFGREAGECGWQPIRRYMYGIDRWKPAKNQCFFLNEFFLSTRVGNSLFRSFALCSFTLFTLLKRATGAICSCRSLQKEGVNDSLFTKRGSDLLLSLLQKRERFALFTLNKKRKRLALVALYKKR